MAVVGVAAGGWGIEVGVEVLALQAASNPASSNMVHNVIFLFIIMLFLFM
jgi:hypothetical protein